MGIIGMGDMGKMYARRISDAGWRYVGTMRPRVVSSKVRPRHVLTLFNICNDDLSAFGSSMVALAPVATVMVQLTRRPSLMENLSYLSLSLSENVRFSTLVVLQTCTHTQTNEDNRE